MASSTRARAIPRTKYREHVRKAYWQDGRKLPLYEDTTPATLAEALADEDNPPTEPAKLEGGRQVSQQVRLPL